jgi:hypothetical protein
MIHSHTYVEVPNAGTAFDGLMSTSHPVPCGAVEEFYEIIRMCPQRDRTFVSINLVGHGSLTMVKDVSSLMNIKYIPRIVPEVL